MRDVIVKFGLLAAALMLLLLVSQYSLVTRYWKVEILVSTIAIVFIIFGFYLAKMISTKKYQPTNSQTPHTENIKASMLSARELEVLQQMASGKSNREIAESLFIAESTVKSHVSSILEKLHAKRRTEAIIKAQHLKLISDVSTI
ncbi:MAG: response regulator transcription factor [Fulvivirga sp.]|nr:response regulator transcription factor [Fulvivirga sp.]